MTANTFIPKRGRPTAQQVAAIEQTILTTARRMFLEHGYDSMTMEGVASAASISKGTLYARHPSKESLLTAVVHSSVEEWSINAARDDYLLTDDIGDRLRHHAHSIATSIGSPEIQALQRLLLTTRERFPAFSAALYETGYLYIVNLIADDIRRAATRDAIPARNPDVVARTLVATIYGWQAQESLGRTVGPDELAKMATNVVDILMAGRSAW